MLEAVDVLLVPIYKYKLVTIVVPSLLMLPVKFAFIYNVKIVKLGMRAIFEILVMYDSLNS